MWSSMGLLRQWHGAIEYLNLLLIFLFNVRMLAHTLTVPPSPNHRHPSHHTCNFISSISIVNNSLEEEGGSDEEDDDDQTENKSA